MRISSTISSVRCVAGKSSFHVGLDPLAPTRPHIRRTPYTLFGTKSRLLDTFRTSMDEPGQDRNAGNTNMLYTDSLRQRQVEKKEKE